MDINLLIQKYKDTYRFQPINSIVLDFLEEIVISNGNIQNNKDLTDIVLVAARYFDMLQDDIDSMKNDILDLNDRMRNS